MRGATGAAASARERVLGRVAAAGREEAGHTGPRQREKEGDGDGS